MTAEVLIEVRDLARHFTLPRRSLTSPAPVVHALDGVDLQIHRGERFGIVGESGSGKSTLARLMMGLDHPTRGVVEFAAQRVSGQPERRLRFVRQRMQMVFQDPMSSLDPRMKVRDIVLEPLTGLGIDMDRTARLRELLDAVNLPASAADRYPHQFSGGQRQRIAVARALAPSPDVLVADEAVSALDVSVRAQTLNLLMDLTQRFGLTLVFVSHDLSVIRFLTERVAVMRSGRVVELGPTAQVYARPEHEYTRELLGSVPRLRHRIVDQAG